MQNLRTDTLRIRVQKKIYTLMNCYSIFIPKYIYHSLKLKKFYKINKNPRAAILNTCRIVKKFLQNRSTRIKKEKWWHLHNSVCQYHWNATSESRKKQKNIAMGQYTVMSLQQGVIINFYCCNYIIILVGFHCFYHTKIRSY